MTYVEAFWLNGWLHVLALVGVERSTHRRRNGAYQLHCVFHHERSPSLFLYPSGRYYCYGCQAGGTVNDFVTDLTGEVEEPLPPALQGRQEHPAQLELPLWG